jgi:hypothetical protein
MNAFTLIVGYCQANPSSRFFSLRQIIFVRVFLDHAVGGEVGAGRGGAGVGLLM